MMSVMPGRDPLIEKMTPEHVTAVIANKDKDGEREHTQEMAKIASHRWYFVGGAIAIFALCWLFLNYKQTEHLDAVLGVLAGLAGGYGLGKSQSSGEHKA